MTELKMMRLMELAPGKKAVIRRLEGGPQFFHVWLQCVLHPEPLLLFYEVATMGPCWSLYAVRGSLWDAKKPSTYLCLLPGKKSRLKQSTLALSPLP